MKNGRKTSSKMLLVLFIAFVLFSYEARSEGYYWCAGRQAPMCQYRPNQFWLSNPFPSPEAARAEFEVQWRKEYPTWIVISRIISVTESTAVIKVLLSTPDGRSASDSIWIFRRGGNECLDGGLYEPSRGACEIPGDLAVRKELGDPNDGIGCSVNKLAGDPINIAVGNSFQAEKDYLGGGDWPLGFVRYYNSLSGSWTHNYSDRLIIAPNAVSLISSNGKVSVFKAKDGRFFSEADNLGGLEKVLGGWKYVSVHNAVLMFNENGQLTSRTAIDEPLQNISYSGNDVVVTDVFGRKLSFTHDERYQPVKFSAANVSIDYKYYKGVRLSEVVFNRGGVVSQRSYDYSVNSLLTGITDERGIRYVSWTYDDQGRAISNALYGNAGVVTVSYKSDGSTEVVNELGRRAVYRYKVIQGVRRIISIEGEASSGCAASNTAYVYNEEGRVVTRTDAEGIKTIYEYNERGLESRRIEAAGSPLSRSIFTEWDSSRILPTKITFPNRTIFFSYDAQGHKLMEKTVMN